MFSFDNAKDNDRFLGRPTTLVDKLRANWSRIDYIITIAYILHKHIFIYVSLKLANSSIKLGKAFCFEFLSAPYDRS